MDKRFYNLFNLTEAQAIALLDTPPELVSEEDSRYIAASHLVNFPTESSIQALIRAVENTNPILENRIVRRKAIETLGRLQATEALPVIHGCLSDEDCYTVENAAWAIGEIGTDDLNILADLTQVLERPNQTYRVIIHTLTKLQYYPALELVRRFVHSQDLPTASAAITSVCRLTQDTTQMHQVVALLQHPNVLARRLSIQDLIDANYYDAIPAIASCPVSLVFRLRGIRLLAESGLTNKAITFLQVKPSLEQTLRDHPDTLRMVHRYKSIPPLPQLIEELYETDFGRCYLATQTILNHYSPTAPLALAQDYQGKGYEDYGAHFHLIKLFGWLHDSSAYDWLIQSLHHSQPQYQKSRAAAAIALGELNDPRAIPDLKACLSSTIWDLRYAALLALAKLTTPDDYQRIIHPLTDDSDFLIREKVMDEFNGKVP